MKTAKKDLIERLDEEDTKKPSGRVTFLLQKTAISEALEKGFTIKSIHQVMLADGDISIGYSAFTRLVNTHILQKKEKKIPQLPPRGRKFVHSSDSSKWAKTVPEEDRKFDSSEYMNYPKGYKKEDTPKK